jgi:hypothetical protein
MIDMVIPLCFVTMRNSFVFGKENTFVGVLTFLQALCGQANDASFLLSLPTSTPRS